MKKILAILLAFLLTGALALFCVSFVGRQAIAPAMREGGAPVSDAVLRAEQQLAEKRVRDLADLYRFDAEPVIDLINAENTLGSLNSQASLWWSTLLKDGIVGDRPEWDTEELEQVIGADARLAAMEDRERAEYLAVSGTESVRGSMIRMVLPMRLETVRLGVQKIEKKVDAVNLISFFMGVPWAALALCALLAGLIVLLRSGKFRGPLQYIGSALGAAALVMAAVMVLCLCAGIGPMIREASEGLAIQYGSMVSGALLRAGILTAVMAAGCVLCLLGSRKNGTAA